MHREHGGAANATLPTDPDTSAAVGDPRGLDPRLTTCMRSILIATDTREIASNAIRVGFALCDELDACAEVVSVPRSRPSPVAVLAVAPNVHIEPVVLRGPADAELLSLGGRPVGRRGDRRRQPPPSRREPPPARERHRGHRP